MFEHLTDLVYKTQCKIDGNDFRRVKCVERKCNDCGLQNFKFSEQELDEGDDAPVVEWMCYEYVTFKVKKKV